jgi:TatD DNase family protein
MELTDTHCHLQFEKYTDPAQVVENARVAGVSRLICVGTSLVDSHKAIGLAGEFSNVWASVGSHPHEASQFLADSKNSQLLNKLSNSPKIVAIGEIGLDYYKNYSPRDDQKKALRAQIEATYEHGLPFIFHVRDAWDDFWQILDAFPTLTGVIHSFSAGSQELEQILRRELYVGLNGIMTFTDDQRQLKAAKAVPLDRLLLETDAPFLTPKPHRGQLCEPKHVVDVAKFLAGLRSEELEGLAQATTSNALELFKLEASSG